MTGPIQNSSTVGTKVVFSKVLPKGIAIDFDAEPAALTGLPEGKQEGTYVFLCGGLPPHGSLPVRYDVAHELRISAGRQSCALQLGLVSEEGTRCQSGTGTVTETRIPLVTNVYGRFRGTFFLKEAPDE